VSIRARPEASRIHRFPQFASRLGSFSMGLGNDSSAQSPDDPFNICCFIRISSHGTFSMIRIQSTCFFRSLMVPCTARESAVFSASTRC
jgi:hypothetical protein